MHSRSMLSHLRLLPLLCACLAVAQPAVAQHLPGWQLLLNDEFSGTSVNTDNWVPLNRLNSFNNEWQDYQPSQVSVSGGNLVLTGEKINALHPNYRGREYLSGLVTSKIPYGLEQPGTEYTALRVEARIKLPTTQGMWPAFWMNPNELIDWPKGGEIDILENKGHEPNRVSSAYHWQATNNSCCGDHRFVARNHDYSGPSEGNFHNAFHTYAVEWEPTQLRFYVDDVLYHTVTEQSASPANSQNNRPVFEFPKYIILNLAIGGDFLGSQQPNESTIWPQQMLIDYVRVWSQPVVATIPEPATGALVLLGAFLLSVRRRRPLSAATTYRGVYSGQFGMA